MRPICRGGRVSRGFRRAEWRVRLALSPLTRHSIHFVPPRARQADAAARAGRAAWRRPSAAQGDGGAETGTSARAKAIRATRPVASAAIAPSSRPGARAGACASPADQRARRSASSRGRRPCRATSPVRAAPARPRAAAASYAGRERHRRGAERARARSAAATAPARRRPPARRRRSPARRPPAGAASTRLRAPAASAPVTEPRPIATRQRRVGRRAAVPGEARDQRQQDLEVEGERPDHGHHRQRDHAARACARTCANAVAQLPAGARGRRGASAAARVHQLAARRASPRTRAR